MGNIQNILEYYDELYPVTEEQKKFYGIMEKRYNRPVKFLDIGCGTGTFEHQLAINGNDVTGLDTCREFLESANRRRRTQLMAVRFFQMSTIEMTRFLGKGFYNIISCLNDRIVFIHDRTLMRKFFFDCKTLAAPGGTLILELYNYDKWNAEPLAKLPTLSTIRANLYSQLWTKEDGEKYMQQDLESGNGKLLPVIEDAKIYPLKKDEIIDFASEAGFSQFTFYNNFDFSEFSTDSDKIVCCIS